MMEREKFAASGVAEKKGPASDLPAAGKASASTGNVFADVREDDEILCTPPPRSPTALNYLHSLVAIPLIYLYTLVMGSLSLTLSLYDPGGRRQHWCAQVWCRLIARTSGARVSVYGVEHIAPGTSYVFLSTHQSYMDIPAMLGYLPAQLRIAAKKILFRIPFMGWHLWRAGHIPIDRSSTENAVMSMQRAGGYIRSGICAFVFPEGTRSRDGHLHGFKKGGFKLALQAQVPIIPITIIGSRQVLPPDSIIFRPGTIDMYVDEPIPTAGLTDGDIEMLMRRVRAAMARHIRARQEAPRPHC
jgi:1-acyl-sn-glycerol-3-phosphate acyltransferase